MSWPLADPGTVQNVTGTTGTGPCISFVPLVRRLKGWQRIVGGKQSAAMRPSRKGRQVGKWAAFLIRIADRRVRRSTGELEHKPPMQAQSKNDGQMPHLMSTDDPRNQNYCILPEKQSPQ